MLTRSKPLMLHEELMLLMLRDERGTLEPRTQWHGYALAGAMLAELLRSGRIALSHDRKPLVEVRDRGRTGDDLLDECIEKIATARRRRKLDGWLTSSDSKSTPMLRAQAGSKAYSASISAAIPPSFWALAMTCKANVVLPLDSGPNNSMIRPRGIPCPPNAMSNDKQPVGIPSTTRLVPSPNCMIAPLPNCFSIWPSVFFSSFSSCETWVAIHSLSWLETRKNLLSRNSKTFELPYLLYSWTLYP